MMLLGKRSGQQWQPLKIFICLLVCSLVRLPVILVEISPKTDLTIKKSLKGLGTESA